MAFIEKSDLENVIDGYILDDITEFDDNKLEAAIKYAIAYMKADLTARYDVEAIFSKTGDDRDPVILTHTIDIVLFRLHYLINWSQIPAFRKEQYNEVKYWLEQVREQNINPDLPLPASPDKEYIAFGGQTKRENHY